MQLYLQKEVSVQIFGLHVDLSPKEYYIINLNLFLTIPNQKGLWPKCTLVIEDTVRQQIVMIVLLAIVAGSPLLKNLRLLFNLNMGDKATVGRGILLFDVRIWAIRLLIVNIRHVLFPVESALEEVEALIEKFNIPEWLKMNRCFNERIKWHF